MPTDIALTDESPPDVVIDGTGDLATVRGDAYILQRIRLAAREIQDSGVGEPFTSARIRQLEARAEERIRSLPFVTTPVRATATALNRQQKTVEMTVTIGDDELQTTVRQ